ncbi:hypothetical protein CYMTET_42262 [Cymbomonas tetramitiformis]|uniref:Uncharacterized protein n=1 Tax=Cymbomonas tetramitiformis TaxID=36881 RepID=A0AAE0C4H8_9CHLO|nr:hypothetical protein CYMTET_42262 [Cymbomonas tetramitiformis]
MLTRLDTEGTCSMLTEGSDAEGHVLTTMLTELDARRRAFCLNVDRRRPDAEGTCCDVDRRLNGARASMLTEGSEAEKAQGSMPKGIAALLTRLDAGERAAMLTEGWAPGGTCAMLTASWIPGTCCAMTERLDLPGGACCRMLTAEGWMPKAVLR